MALRLREELLEDVLDLDSDLDRGVALRPLRPRCSWVEALMLTPPLDAVVGDSTDAPPPPGGRVIGEDFPTPSGCPGRGGRGAPPPNPPCNVNRRGRGGIPLRLREMPPPPLVPSPTPPPAEALKLWFEFGLNNSVSLALPLISPRLVPPADEGGSGCIGDIPMMGSMGSLVHPRSSFSFLFAGLNVGVISMSSLPRADLGENGGANESVTNLCAVRLGDMTASNASTSNDPAVVLTKVGLVADWP